MDLKIKQLVILGLIPRIWDFTLDQISFVNFSTIYFIMLYDE